MDQHDEPTLASIDTSKPSVARIYDYYLGGKDNFQVDRDAAATVARSIPEIRDLAQENRAFLRRAVRYLSQQGVRQFLDIGSGLPTQQNTHQVAQEINPEARVVYVDNDPVVQAFGRALLATDRNTALAAADMRDPTQVLGHPQTIRLIDFREPVGVLMLAMTQFLSDEERLAVMGQLRDALAPGSFLVVTHVTGDNHSSEETARVEAVYANTQTPIYIRTHAEIARFFDGFDLVDPGLVTLETWRSEPGELVPGVSHASWAYGAVGRKN